MAIWEPMECFDPQAWILDSIASAQGKHFKAKELEDRSMGSTDLVFHIIQKQPASEYARTMLSRHSSSFRSSSLQGLAFVL